MLAEGLAKLEQLAVKAAGVTIHQIPGDADHLLVACNGEINETRDIPPVHRNHKIASLDDFVAAVARWGAKGTIWHSAKGVVLVIDDEARRDVVTFPLEASAQFSRLMALAREPRLGQAGIIRLLRHDLAGAVPADLVTVFRKVDFKRRSDGTATIAHGKESLGRTVEAEVSGTAELPDVITPVIRVYRSAGIIWKKAIRLTLDVDPANETFTLCPEPDALDEAIQSTQADIRTVLSAELDDDPARIFFGEATP